MPAGAPAPNTDATTCTVPGSTAAAGAGSAPGPRRSPGTSRLAGVDAARGLALFGIIAVHALLDTTDDGVPTLGYMVFGGRSAALFAVLAGVSFAFMTGRARVRVGPDLVTAAATLATRAGVVLLLGLALSGTDPNIAAVILPYYAVAFLLAIPLVAVPTRVLAPIAALLCLGVPVLSHVVRRSLRLPDLTNPSLAGLLTDPPGLLAELTLTGAYPAVIWWAYMAVGIVVGRLRLDAMRTASGLVVVGVTAALATATLSIWLLGPAGGYAAVAAAGPPDLAGTAPTIADAVNGYPDGVTPTTTWWWLATIAPHSGTPLEVVHTTGCALAVLGVILLLTRVASRVPGPFARFVPAVLAAAGTMTLTLYVASILFLNSGLDVFDPVEGYVWQVVVATAVALAWRRAVGRGPLESLVSAPARAVRDHLRARAHGGSPRDRAYAAARHR